MPKRDVVYLAFAQSEEPYLEFLKEEYRAIFNLFRNLQDEGSLEVYAQQSISHNDLFNDFNTYKNRILLFHFSGHAGGEKLQLDSGGAQAEALAKLFGREKEKLKLVFLNGCATKAQVENLHKQGIDAVIATQSKVDDQIACEFSIKFYESFSNANTLEEAFEFAALYIESRADLDIKPQIFRFFDTGNEEKEGTSFPWGLYIREDAEEILQWKLIGDPSPSLPPSVFPRQKVNQDILRILEAMVKYDPSLSHELQKKPREAKLSILKSFPWVMSAQIRRFIANTDQMNKLGTPRLKQLIQAYISTTQFLAYIQLALLGNYLYTEKSEETDKRISHFSIDKQKHESFDYVQLLLHCHDAMEKESSLLPEMKNLIKSLQKNGKAHDHYQTLESIRGKLLSSEVNHMDIGELCSEAEIALTELLIHVSFLAKYRLLTVKDILTFNPKFIPTKFKHQMGELHVLAGDLMEEDDHNHLLSKFTYSYSVILVEKGKEEKVESHICLSPFIIDRNAFEPLHIPAIYTFAYPEDGTYLFKNADIDISKEMPEELDILNISDQEKDYEMVLKQFELFL